MKIKEYIVSTFYMWVFFTASLTVLAFTYWGFTIDQWIRWAWSGIPANLVLNYPALKTCNWLLRRLFGDENRC